MKLLLAFSSISSISRHVTVGSPNYECQLQLAETTHLLIRVRRPFALRHPPPAQRSFDKHHISLNKILESNSGPLMSCSPSETYHLWLMRRSSRSVLIFRVHCTLLYCRCVCLDNFISATFKCFRPPLLQIH